MKTDLPPLYIVAYDGEDIPGIMHVISKCVYEEGFTVVDVSMASGAGIYKIFITCHRRTDRRKGPVELSEHERGIADESWLQTRIQKMLDVHYKDYFHRILDEKAPSLSGKVSVRRHTNVEARWTIAIDLQLGEVVGALAAITGLLSLYVNIDDMLVRAIVHKPTHGGSGGHFIWKYYLQTSLLSNEIYDPQAQRSNQYFIERKKAVEQSMPPIFKQKITELQSLLEQTPANATEKVATAKQRQQILETIKERPEATLWEALMHSDTQRAENLKDANTLALAPRQNENRVREEQVCARKIAKVLYEVLEWADFAYFHEFQVTRLDVGYQSPHSQSGSGVTWEPGSGKPAKAYSVPKQVTLIQT